MTDKPIIFSAPMIRALLDGRKNQTRRVLKPQPDTTSQPSGQGAWGAKNRYGYWAPAAEIRPYAPGDRLWVREAFNQFWFSQDGDYAWPSKPIIGPAEIREIEDEGSRVSPPQLVYRESDRAKEWFKGQSWRSPIHMPRWASRLTLTVTDVRVQRLQDISEADAVAEGVNSCSEGHICPNAPHGGCCGSYDPIGEYRDIWNSLHGPNAWAANPWVCAITFDVTRGNIDSGAV